MSCINCGEDMYGDGYTTTIQCPNWADDEIVEADGGPMYCTPLDEDNV